MLDCRFDTHLSSGLILSVLITLLMWYSTNLRCEGIPVRITDDPEQLEHFQLDQDLFSKDDFRIAFISEKPINLNTAGLQDFLLLPFIDLKLAKKIMQLRHELGEFRSVDELLNLSEISVNQLETIKPFITITQEPQFELKLKVDNLLVQSADDEKSSKHIFDSVQTLYSLQTHLEHTHVDLSVSRRLGSKAEFDSTSGLVSSQGIENITDLDVLSIYNLHNANFAWVIGHYQAGFAQSLTFDNSLRYLPEGLYIDNVYLINHFTGKIKSKPSLFGAAMDTSFRIGNNTFDVALFASQEKRDLQPKDLTYSPDEWIAPFLGDCIDAGQTKGPFFCNGFGQWMTSSIDVQGIIHPQYKQLLKDVFVESLLGQRIAWKSQNYHVGLVHYNAKSDFVISAPQIRFSPLSEYPPSKFYQATGLYVNYSKNFDLSGEVSFTQNSGLAWFVRLDRQLSGTWRINLSARYYNPYVKNPHSRGEIAQFEHRNEQGFRTLVKGRFGSVESTSFVDVWQHPYTLINGTQFQRLKNPSVNMAAKQKWNLQLGSHHFLGLVIMWTEIRKPPSVEFGFFDNVDFAPGRQYRFAVNYSVMRNSHQFGIAYTTVIQQHDYTNVQHNYSAVLTQRISSRLSSQIFIQTKTNSLLTLEKNSNSEVDQPILKLYCLGKFSFDRNWSASLRAGYLRFKKAQSLRLHQNFSVAVSLTSVF